MEINDEYRWLLRTFKNLSFFIYLIHSSFFVYVVSLLESQIPRKKNVFWGLLHYTYTSALRGSHEQFLRPLDLMTSARPGTQGARSTSSCHIQLEEALSSIKSSFSRLLALLTIFSSVCLQSYIRYNCVSPPMFFFIIDKMRNNNYQSNGTLI